MSDQLEEYLKEERERIDLTSDSDADLKAKLHRIANALGVGQYARHIFLCVGPDCCAPEKGQESWNYLKRRLRELGLVNHSVYRTKVGCFRICRGGPIAVVYPEGVWYRGVNPDACERIIQEHLIEGRIVEEFAFAVNPLPVSENETAP